MLTNSAELLDILKHLHNLTGFRISIHDTEFKELIAYPSQLCDYCRFIQTDPDMHTKCLENDKQAFCKVMETNRLHMYQCHAGLNEVVAPIHSFDTLAGYLMMGQTVDEDKTSRNHILANSSRLAFDKAKLQLAVNAIPSSNQQKLLSCASIMDICAQYITLVNRYLRPKNDLAVQIKNYIDEKYNTKICINDLCDYFFCSRATISRVFQNRYHTGINYYINSVRMKHACDLLSHSSKSIKEIAALCGFSEQNYFCKTFIKMMGLSPSQYKINNQMDQQQ